MKRTEMLNLMAWRIRDIRKYDCTEMDVAVELLDEMEKAGMLPPPKSLENVTARIKYYNTFETENDENIDIYPTNASEYLWEEE